MTYSVVTDEPFYKDYILKRRMIATDTHGSITYTGDYEILSAPGAEFISDSTLVTKDSVVTPGYRKKVPDDLPMHPYEYYRERIEYPNGRYLGYKNAGGYNYWDYVLEGRFPATEVSLGDVNFSPSVGEVDGRCRNKILLKLKNQKINLGVAFGERAQTAALLTTNISRIFTAYKKAKRLDFVGAAEALGVHWNPNTLLSQSGRKKQLDSVASGWLELQYGWMPLLSDCQGAVDAFNESRRKKHRFEKVMATEKFTGEEISLIPHCTSGSFKTRRRKYSVKYTVYFGIQSELDQTLSSLGITNLLSIAWELVPFSFVADWFIKVGDYLNAADATMGLFFHKGCVSIYDEDYLRVDFETAPGDGFDFSTVRWSGSGSGFRKSTRITRTVLSDFPQSSIPTFKDPFSVTHVANAAALFQLLFRK